MTTSARPAAARSRWRLFAWGLSALVAVVFVAANAHLIAVAVATQPDCVAPPFGGGAAYRAAQPSC